MSDLYNKGQTERDKLNTLWKSNIESICFVSEVFPNVEKLQNYTLLNEGIQNE